MNLKNKIKNKNNSGKAFNNKSKILKLNKTKLKKWLSHIKLVKNILANCKITPCSTLYTLFRHKVTNLMENNGFKATITWFKQNRIILYKYISSDPVISDRLVKKTKDGIPQWFGDHIKSIRERDTTTLRAIISLLNIGRLFVDVGEVDTSTIETINDVRSENIISNRIISNFKKKFSINPELGVPKFVIRSTNGPFGPSMTTIIEEAKMLLPEDLENFKILTGPHRDSTETETIINTITDIKHPEVVTPPHFNKHISTPREKFSLRKITVVADKECKNRVIAILDYWTQLFLKPLHSALMAEIKDCFGDNDSTFNQDLGVQKMIELQKSSHTKGFWSLDLKSATDLLPMQLQKRLMVSFFGEEFSEAWCEVLTGRPYYIAQDNKFVRYGTGQPMGAYSSWAMLALSHHLIVYAAASKARMVSSYRRYYSLLGDDIVIAHPKLAKSYMEVIKDLSMEIQLTKSLVSKDSFEFTKRFFRDGSEISPLPLGHLSYAKTHYWVIADFMSKCEDLGYSFTGTDKVASCIIKSFSTGRKVKYLANKTTKYFNSINPYKDNWEDMVHTKFPRWISPKVWRIPCNMRDETFFQFMIEMFLHFQMNIIHEKLVTITKNTNRWLQQEYFKDWYLEKGTYHPLVNVIFHVTETIRAIEYTNSSNSIEATNTYFKMKVSAKDFLLFPTNIEDSFSKSNHQATLKFRAVLNSNLEDWFKSTEAEKKKLLSLRESDWIDSEED